MKKHFFKKKMKLSKKIIVIITIILLSVTFASTLGRYVYNFIVDFYFSTKNFYFESDKLAKDGAVYLLDHYNGVDPYEIKVDVNSYKNNELRSNSDVYYNISYNCSSTVICSSSKDSGMISKTTNTDSFTVYMTPNSSFSDNDSIIVEVIATSTSPYEKKLYAQFRLVVGKFGLGYEIDDSKGSPYLEVRVTNTLNYYTVKEKFDNYEIGKQIDEVTYSKLSLENKAKCTSAIIKANFDPNIVYMDNNSDAFLSSYDHQSQKIGSYDYIKSFKFKMEASSSSVFRLYKRDSSKDYTNSDVVDINYEF